MSKKLTDDEHDLLLCLEAAYAEDPSPECGRQYCEGEEEFEVASSLLKKGLTRKVESGTFKEGRKKLAWIHFGLTDAGFKAAGAL
jgi:hypothetical protein